MLAHASVAAIGVVVGVGAAKKKETAQLSLTRASVSPLDVCSATGIQGLNLKATATATDEE